MHHPKPQSRQALIPPIIGNRVMRIAIDFHRQPDRRTKEINDRPGFKHNMLSPKLEAAELAVGKNAPQPLLRLRGITPHFTRVFQQLCFGHAGLPHPNPSPEGEGLRSAVMTCALPLPTAAQSLS
jgi:hypothetical protein